MGLTVPKVNTYLYGTLPRAVVAAPQERALVGPRGPLQHVARMAPHRRGHVSSDGRVRRGRAVYDPGEGQGRPGKGQGEGQAPGPAAPALTPRQRRQVHQDRAEGMSLRALARKYGTTAPTVRRVLDQGEPA